MLLTFSQIKALNKMVINQVVGIGHICLASIQFGHVYYVDYLSKKSKNMFDAVIKIKFKHHLWG